MKRDLLLLKTVVIVTLLYCCGSVNAQETYYWQRANLLFDLPFNISDTLVYADEDGILIERDDIEIDLEIIIKDSIKHQFDDLIEGVLFSIAHIYDFIITGTLQQLPLITEGKYITAIDTFLLTDSLVLGVFTEAGSEWVIIAIIDCYETSMSTGLSIMRSMRFRDPALRKEEN